jgi:guanylate kinase
VNTKRIITISGVAGAGKDTIIDGAMPYLRSFGIGWAHSVTTRDPRESDRPGAMIRVSREKFLTMAVLGDMMEYTTVTGSMYGSPSEAMDAGPHGAIKIATVDGVRSIRAWMVDNGMEPCSQMLPIYVTVPREHSHSRLIARGWSEYTISQRESFNLPGYGPDMVAASEVGMWSIIHNPDGGLEQAVDSLVRTVRDFLR